MGQGGLPHAQLSALRGHYGLSLDGVGLSIGRPGSLDRDHLARLHHLCDRYEPESFSEHLAWSSHDGAYLNDLLPLPYTAETPGIVCDEPFFQAMAPAFRRRIPRRLRASWPGAMRSRVSAKASRPSGTCPTSPTWRGSSMRAAGPSTPLISPPCRPRRWREPRRTPPPRGVGCTLRCRCSPRAGRSPRSGWRPHPSSPAELP